jgi:UDP-N-acetylmuramoyl-L-alanyl-D-glutamate--2,6-diaminopimelate ligase
MLFVARGGTRAAGRAFIPDALEKGAVGVIAEDPVDVPAGVAFARVDNAALAGALLAHEIAGNPTAGMQMIGVTGTKGKTTVAYLLRSVLKGAGHVVGMVGTVEIDDGAVVKPAEMTTPGSGELVELFSRMKANGVTHCVMEVSSHALHQERVAGIDFAAGIFTNLTGDHLDYHKTMEDYAGAKALLFEGLTRRATAVVNGDDAWVERMVRGCQGKVVSYGIEKPGFTGAAENWVGRIERIASDEMMLDVRGPRYERMLKTQLVGRHNAYNLLATISAVAALGEDLAGAMRVLEGAAGAPGRLQRVHLNGEALPFQVFVDYAHTHDALENVLRALRATMKNGGRLLCVFGCGGDRDRTKRPKMGRIAEALADRVFVTSDNPRTEEPGAILDEICTGFSAGWREGTKIKVEADRRAAIRMAVEAAAPGDVVLIAGKGHENYQIIGTAKHHFDDVEEAGKVLRERVSNDQGKPGR